MGYSNVRISWMLALGAFSPAGNLSEGSAFSLSHSHLDSYPKRRGFRTPMLNPWFALSFKAVQLGIDAQNVMALRMMRLASGGKRWSRFAGQNGGLAKVDSGFDYAANFSSFACIA